MLNYVWIAMMVLGFFIGAMNGRIAEVTDAVIHSADSAIKLAISLLGVICMWSGLMNIAQKSGLVIYLSKVIQPILSFLFPDIKKNRTAIGAIVMNFIANTLGLGNAATPLGIKAMHELQKINIDKSTASDSMCTFLILSATCFQLMPTTVIALRAAAGSANPTGIITPIWITSFCTMLTGVLVTKILTSLF